MRLTILLNELQQQNAHVREQWQQAAAVWDDAMRWQFENDVWKPLQNEVAATFRELENLAAVVASARRDIT